MSDHRFWLKSNLYEIEPGEEEETNPGCYGKQLATWLRSRLIEEGYRVEPVIPEDWGWCVMCMRVPFMLWVGCVGSRDEGAKIDTSLPSANNVTWSCFVTSEIPLLRRLFGRIDATSAVDKLYGEVKGILQAEPTITLMAGP